MTDMLALGFMRQALLAALLVARTRWRGPALLLTAVVMLAGAAVLGGATRSDAFSVVAPEGVAAGVSQLAVEAQRALRPALEGALAPYAAGLSLAGWITLGVGALVLLVELLLTRGRRGRRGRVTGAAR